MSLLFIIFLYCFFLFFEIFFLFLVVRISKVGESIPVIDEKEYILGIISESDLFNALLIAEKERNEEELN